MKSIPILLTFLALLFIACGGGGSGGSDSGSGSGSIFDQARDAVSQMEETAKNMQEGKNVAVSDFRNLKAWMPGKIGGLEQVETEGQNTASFGINMSNASALYQSEDRRVQLEVIDFGGFQAALLGMAAWVNYDIERESNKEYERTTTIEGKKAFVKYNYERKAGEINLLTDRFIVNLRAYNIEEKDFRDLPKELAFGKLDRIEPKKQ